MIPVPRVEQPLLPTVWARTPWTWLRTWRFRVPPAVCIASKLRYRSFQSARCMLLLSDDFGYQPVSWRCLVRGWKTRIDEEMVLADHVSEPTLAAGKTGVIPNRRVLVPMKQGGCAQAKAILGCVKASRADSDTRSTSRPLTTHHPPICCSAAAAALCFASGAVRDFSCSCLLLNLFLLTIFSFSHPPRSLDFNTVRPPASPLLVHLSAQTNRLSRLLWP